MIQKAELWKRTTASCRAWCVLVLVCFLSAQAIAQPSTTPVPLHPQFQRFFDQRLTEEKVPGGVFAIIHRDQVHQIHSYGVRSMSDGVPVTEDTVFRVASVSKTFAGTLATILNHHEYFSWEDALTQYIPNFEFEQPALASQIQLQHIVSHSAGLVPNAYDNLIEANYTLPRVLPFFKSINPMCEPGTCYGYQNVLFNLLEPVIERTTGQSYESLVAELLFEPLGMKDSSIGLEGFFQSENIAMPHVKGRISWFQRTPTAHYYHYPAAAGVNASARDLAQWLIAHMGYRPDVISEDILADIRTPRVQTTRDLRRRYWRQYLRDAHYTAGWRKYNFDDYELFYHGGWVEGYRAMIAYVPEFSVGLVMLLNAESNVISELGAAFWADVLPRLEEEQWVPYYHAGSNDDDKNLENTAPTIPRFAPFLPQIGNSEMGEGLLNK